MGQEISRTRFTDADFAQFAQRLAGETQLLETLFRARKLADSAWHVGFELEGWLVDRDYVPAPVNAEFLAALNDPLVVPELSRFNVELNSSPQALAGRCFSALEQELTQRWRHCLDVSHDLGYALMLVGILPTVRERDLTMAQVSALKRYAALNEQVLKRRLGKPLVIDIEGDDRLHTTHKDVMLEAATTSFQLHLQVPATDAARFYNVSMIASAPLLAASTNSPFLFGRRLWQETRVPLFEQAVAAHTPDAPPSDHRVSFGTGYLEHSIVDYFIDCAVRFPVLLPMLSGAEPQRFDHLRLHNGTVWRWNRPLIGFENDGTPHIRIEQRVLPAGPSIIDMMANAAFYVGLTIFLARLDPPVEADIRFDAARANFYAAARDGLDARIRWLDGKPVRARELLQEELIPMARQGLRMCATDEADITRYLDVLDRRVREGQTGAVWQRAYLERHGADFHRLSAAYLEHQRSGAPVHEWSV